MSETQTLRQFVHLAFYKFTNNVLVELSSSKFDIGSVAIWSRSNRVLLPVFCT